MDLFRSAPIAQPLAARLRATNLDEYVGQEHVLARGKPLREALEQGALHSMIFWGPPGVGKTTLARLLAEVSDAHFETVSAVLAGVKEIRQAVEIAKQQAGQYGKRTILFVDEVHRFNKSQQDAFLPYVEDGTLIFIGATTENPSFELNNALLSRARVYVLKSLDEAALRKLVHRALTEERGLGKRNLTLSDEGFQMLLSGRRWRWPASAQSAGKRLGPGRRRQRDRHRAAAKPARRHASAFRQGRRGVLRPDLGAAQIGARLQSRWRAVLVCADDRRRLRSAVPGPARGAHGQ